MSVLTHERVVAITFTKGLPGAGITGFEEVLVYGILGKLALFTEISCKDMATKPDRVILDPNQTYEKMLETIRQVAVSKRSRFVMTGSLLPQADSEGLVDSIKITLRLYDAEENRFVIDTTMVLSRFEPGHQSLSDISVPMEDLSQVLNWAVFEIVQAILPKKADQLIPEISRHTFTSSYQALQQLVKAEDITGSVSEKITAYETAVQLDPNLEIAHYNLGKLYKTSNDYRQSVHSFKRAIEVSQSAGKVKALYANEAGIVCALMNQYEPAIQWWLRAIEYAPAFINPYMNIAHAYEEADKIAEAEQFFLKAQQLAPRDIRSYYSLARIYSKNGEWMKAIDQYKNSLTLDEGDPWCHSNIATCYLQLGDNAEALRHLERTVALDEGGEAGQYAQMILTALASNA